MLKVLSLVLVLWGQQTAHADVLVSHRGGPTCDASVKACTLLLQINGEITDNTVRQVQQSVDKTRKQAEVNKYFFSFLAVELNSEGGSVDAAMAIGRIIRKEEAGAWVGRGSICLSACVLVLAGGSFRTFEGTIGVHRPYFAVPKADVSSNDVKTAYQSMLQNIRAYLREMNVAEDLADAMLRINPENMRVLDSGELAHFGLTEVDPMAGEAFELQQAQSLGIDRHEYMRRKLLAEQQCGGAASLGTQCYRNIMKSGHTEQVDFSRYGRVPGQN